MRLPQIRLRVPRKEYVTGELQYVSGGTNTDKAEIHRADKSAQGDLS